jgi:hypothetical protein
MKEKLIQEIKDIIEKYDLHYMTIYTDIYKLSNHIKTNRTLMKEVFLSDLKEFNLLELQFTSIKIKNDANKQRKNIFS